MPTRTHPASPVPPTDPAAPGHLDRVRRFVDRDVWSDAVEHMPAWRRALYRIVRVAVLAARGFVRDRCLFRSQALTFITVLSIVPLLAFVVSVAKGLGAYARLRVEVIEPFLDRTFGDGGAANAAADAAAAAVGAAAGGSSTVDLRATLDKVLEFVETTDFSKLGVFGLGILLYAIVKLLSSVEGSFNEIWGVDRARSLVRKISDYLSVLVVVPIFLVLATGVTATVQSGEGLTWARETLHLGPVLEVAMRFSSIFAVWFGFAFVYQFMPNTRVRFFSALLGGLLGGGAWLLVQVAYVRFQIGVANYNALYAGVAAIPIFLVWANLSWVTVLLGAELAFAHQNEPSYRHIHSARETDQSFRERVGLRAVARLAARHFAGAEPIPVSDLADQMEVPERSVEDVLKDLRRAGLLVEVEDRDRCNVFAHDPGAMRVKQVLDALKGRLKDARLEATVPEDEALDGLLDRYEAEASASDHNQTLADLAARYR